MTAAKQSRVEWKKNRGPAVQARREPLPRWRMPAPLARGFDRDAKSSQPSSTEKMEQVCAAVKSGPGKNTTKERRAKSGERRAESEEQRAESEERRAESEERRAESEERRAKSRHCWPAAV